MSSPPESPPSSGGVPAPGCILGRFSAREFVRDYWQKQPLFLPGAAVDFETPITKEALLRLATQEDVEARLVTHTDPNLESPYRLREGPFDAKALGELGGEKWTLLVQDVDKLSRPVAALIDWVDFLPRWSVDDIMASFAAPGGSVGPHVDQYDVFLLQAQGTRIWQLSFYSDDDDLRSDTDMKVLRQFRGAVTYVAHPGDVLYLPPGVAHYGVAEDECITLSFGFRAPTEAALVSAFCDEMVVAASMNLVREPLNAPVNHPAEITPRLVAQVREAIRSKWNLLRDDVRFLGRTLTEPKPNVASFSPGALSVEVLGEHLRKGGGVVRAPSSRFLFLAEDNRVFLFVDGEEYGLDGFVDARKFAVVVTESSLIRLAALEEAAGPRCERRLWDLLTALGASGALALA